MNDNHFIVKISTGEFVYGEIDLENTDKKMVTLKNPLVWEEYETADGYSGTALVKYMNGSKDKKIPIATSSIVSMSQMDKTFSEFYDAAVACQQITDEVYNEKLRHQTKKMIGLVLDYQAKAAAAELDGLIITPLDTDNPTFH